jgi:hypothetical protein
MQHRLFVAAPGHVQVLALTRLRRHETITGEHVPVAAFLRRANHPVTLGAEDHVTDVVHAVNCASLS